VDEADDFAAWVPEFAAIEDRVQAELTRRAQK
jgi:hypothetical protein